MPSDRNEPPTGPEGSKESPLEATLEATLGALLRLVALDDLPRTGWILRGIGAPESIAGHSLGVAHVALALAPRETPPLDLGRVLAMAVVHDAPEALTGDLPRPAARHLPQGAKRAMEDGIARELIEPLSTAAWDAYREFTAQESREARFVKACDRLQLGVRLLAYENAGHGELDEFWAGLDGEASAGRTERDRSAPEFPAAEALRTALWSRRRPRP